MGRETQLLYTTSMFTSEDEESVDIDRINSELLGWRVTSLDYDPVQLVPNVHEYHSIIVGFKNLVWSTIDTHSSVDHILKFEGLYVPDIGVQFPLIEENVIQNLAKTLKKYFVEGEAVFIINDSFSEAVFNYTIRIILRNKLVKVCIEVMDFTRSMKTARLDLFY